MKTLTLIRHAKASWPDEDINDIERPLNERGLSDAPIMADVLGKRLVAKPELILTSNAVRALSTAKIFAERMGYSENSLVIERGIYEKGTKYIIGLIKSQSDEVSSILLFGHNPDVTSLATYFIGEFVDSLPTCSIISIEFDIEHWNEIEDINGKLNFFEIPKKYRQV